MRKEEKKSALGKGIASLLQTPNHSELINKAMDKMKMDDVQHQPNQPSSRPAPEVQQSLSEENPYLVDISSIHVNQFQPRKIFKEKELEELAQSIKENGLIQPLIVTKTDRGLELIAGERRLRASKKAGLEKVPVVIKRATDRDRLVMAIIENVQRSDLNCVEEALAYFQLMEDFKLTQEEVAKRLGKERSTIANFLRILKLPRDVIEHLQKEELSFGHAKVLASLNDVNKIKKLAKEAIDKSLSVRELEKKVKSDEEKIPELRNPFEAEKWEELRKGLEVKTGLHLAINAKKNGAGTLTIKFTNEDEFNRIYEFLMR